MFKHQFNKSKAMQTLSVITNWFSQIEETKEYVIELKEYKKKRSLNANAYMWVLCEAIAQKVGISKIDVYREHIKAVGVYRQAEICDDAVKTLMHSWSLNGTGWLSEKVDCAIHEGFTVVNLYYGSSTYNTKQMSRLLDSVIQDCKDLEIETMTPQQIALLKEKWR